MEKTRKSIFTVLALVLVLTWVLPTMAGDLAQVDLNSATKEQLLSLKGIGESYADRIINYRENNGPFQKKEDIMKVKGIGEKIYQAIKDRIVVQAE